MKNFDTLTQKEFGELYKRWFSFYPLMCYKLDNYEHINFTFNNHQLHRLFNSLMILHPTLKLIQNTFTSRVQNLISSNKFFESLDDIIELGKTYFAFRYSTSRLVSDLRYLYLEKSYTKQHHLDTVLDAVFWRHDGWWNCYYGEVNDKKSIDILLEEYKKKKKSSYEHTRICLTLAYRLAENNQIKLARSLLKKENHFFKFKAMINTEVSVVHQKPFIFKLLYKFTQSFDYFVRWNMNIQTFLYRSTVNEREKKRRLKKLNRRNLLSKFVLHKFLSLITIHKLSPEMRPQHLLRIIEVKIDLWLLTKKEKQKKLLDKEIIHLFEECLKIICSYLYGENSFLLNYFITSEFYFSLHYYLEKVHKINVQRY